MYLRRVKKSLTLLTANKIIALVIFIEKENKIFVERKKKRKELR